MKRIYFADDGATVVNVGCVGTYPGFDGDGNPVDLPTPPEDGTEDVADGVFVGPGMVRQQDGSFAVPVVAPPVPHTVTPRQIRLALIEVGLDDQVDALLGSQSKEVRVAWEYATQVDRDNPLIAMAQQLLGMTDGQADDLFRLAASL